MGGFFKGLFRAAAPIVGNMLGGPIGGAIGSAIGGGIGGGSGSPERAMQQGQQQANQYFGQIPGISEKYLNPFIQEYGPAQQEAKDVYGKMLEQYSSPNVNYQNVPEEYNRMARQPTDFLNDIMKSYSPSAGYQYKQNRLGAAARNTAASGGFAGTKYDQEQQAQLMKDLLGEDMQQYLNNVVAAKGSGLEGLERMMAGREKAYTTQGLSAEERAKRAWLSAESLAESIMNSYGNQGNLAYRSGLDTANSRMNAQNTTNSMAANILGGMGNAMSSAGWFNRGQGFIPAQASTPRAMPSGVGNLNFRPSGFGGGTSNAGFTGFPHAGGYLR